MSIHIKLTAAEHNQVLQAVANEVAKAREHIGFMSEYEKGDKAENALNRLATLQSAYNAIATGREVS